VPDSAQGKAEASYNAIRFILSGGGWRKSM